MSDRPYLFYELTNSLCSACYRKVEAKVVIQDERVYLHKWCPEHRLQKVLISTDVEYYKLSRQTLKPGQMPLRFNTPIQYGCPYDCGLCPDHEQHSCLTLVEVTDRCNLTCPVCYSDSSPQRPSHRSMEQISFLLEKVAKHPDPVWRVIWGPSVGASNFSIYVDANASDIEQWYIERFMKLRATVFQNPDSYFHRYAGLDNGEAEATARRIWETINLVNLQENVLPTRERAHLVLEKGRDHAVRRVRLRMV